jgi:hypothetical protein
MDRPDRDHAQMVHAAPKGTAKLHPPDLVSGGYYFLKNQR